MEEKIKYNTTVIVPIRSGSKGIKNKNIKEFLGLPLYYWTIKKLFHLYKIGKVSKVIVSSDSEWYLEKVKFNFDLIFKENLILSKRPNSLGTDVTTTEEVCINELYKYDIFSGVLGIVEVTSPLIPVGSLELMLDSIGEYVDSSFIVHEEISQFWQCKKPEYVWKKLYNNRKMRQQEDIPLFKEVGAWAIKIDRFLKEKNRIVDPLSPIIVPKEFGLSINTEEDFYYAEYLMKQLVPQIYKDCGIYK